MLEQEVNAFKSFIAIIKYFNFLNKRVRILALYLFNISISRLCRNIRRDFFARKEFWFEYQYHGIKNFKTVFVAKEMIGNDI